MLCAEGDFTSVLFPFLADPDITVRLVPLDTPDRFDHRRRRPGRRELRPIEQRHPPRPQPLSPMPPTVAGARTFLDATQSAGWAEFDADRFDVTVCHGYKWLCSPRGAAFMTVGTAGGEWLRPRSAGWYTGDHPWTSIYGSPLRLAADARRFECPRHGSRCAAAPTWRCSPKSASPRSVDIASGSRTTFVNGSASSRRTPRSSAFPATLPMRSVPPASPMLPRDGRLRFSFYIYNTIADVEAAATIVNAER